MFKVFFKDSSPMTVEVFRAEVIEPCVDFASALHRSSNVPHTIRVAFQGEAETDLVYSLTLTLIDKPVKRDSYPEESYKG